MNRYYIASITLNFQNIVSNSQKKTFHDYSFLLANKLNTLIVKRLKSFFFVKSDLKRQRFLCWNNCKIIVKIALNGHYFTVLSQLNQWSITGMLQFMFAYLIYRLFVVLMRLRSIYWIKILTERYDTETDLSTLHTRVDSYKSLNMN